jgi:aryl-alcohol dehydrogenase-like predicted oxidoreductase
MSKLILGTANFGMRYGLSKRTGSVTVSNVEAILDSAAEYKIEILDTAISYGTAEKVLGQAGASRFKIVGKIPTLRNIASKRDHVIRSVEESCKKLSIDSLDTLLLHDPTDYASSVREDVVAALSYAKDQKLVDRIGISFYSPTEFDWQTNHWKPDVIQVPINVFDTRFHLTGFLNSASSNSVEAHLRSTFLQGLLLKDRQFFEHHFPKWRNIFEKYEDYSIENGNKLQSCIRHSASFDESHRIVVGVSSSQQLKEIVQASELDPQRAPECLTINDANICDPRRWQLKI